MDPRSLRAKEMAINNLKAIELLLSQIKKPLKPEPLPFFTIKEVDSPKTDLSVDSNSK
jgi:hypothetical protein